MRDILIVEAHMEDFCLVLRAAWETEVLRVAGELDRGKEMTELPGH